jgi:hypothetical protein
MMVVKIPEITAMNKVRIFFVSIQILSATAKVMMIPKNIATNGFDGAKRSFQFNQVPSFSMYFSFHEHH